MTATDLTALETPARRSKSSAVATPSAKFIFIGDPNDSGSASRAPQIIDNEENDDAFVGCHMYGIKFPKGKAVDVPLNARIGDSTTLIVNKLRGNSHFFEGDEAELKAAKSAGEVVIKKAPKKVPVLVKHLGVRGLKQAEGVTKSNDDGDDE